VHRHLSASFCARVVPALVLLGRVPMERAVATSLLVISMNSFAGFAGHLGHADIMREAIDGATGD